MANKLVKLGNLAKTLRRDLAANPLKAGVLGVLLLGGLYFWGPLIWKQFGKKAADSTPAAAAAVGSPQPVGALISSVQPGAVVPQEAWQEVRSQRARDPSALSATFRPEWGQIFQSAITVIPPTQPELEVTGARQLDDDPGKLGLLLQGVAVGANSKKAVINGKVYRELDVITVKQTAEHPELKFLVVRVSRRTVEVEHGGRRWQLTLGKEQRPKLVEPVSQNSPQEKPVGSSATKPAVQVEH